MIRHSDISIMQVRYEDMTVAMDIIDNGVRTANERAAAREMLDPSNMNELRVQLSTVATDEKLVDSKFTQVCFCCKVFHFAIIPF